MASPASSSMIGNSHSSEEDLRALMKQRKLKRMQSNRESARRSRMRKQKHLDELAAQASQLRAENSRILAALSVIAQQHAWVETENFVLRAQAAELGATLQFLDEFLCCAHAFGVDSCGGGDSASDCRCLVQTLTVHQGLPPWTSMHPVNQQPVVAAAAVSAADVFLYSQSRTPPLPAQACKAVLLL